MKNKHYLNIDILRFLSLFAVLLYHLNLLKGGYLAVCTFFVLSGYLSVISYSNKEIKLKDYYLKKFQKIYLPLLLVVMTTIGINYLLSIDWINVKAETRSVLFGYNNYWQLNANLDYFVRNISSPFTHFWFIAITLQFELIFPFIYKLLNIIKEKTNKNSTYIILGLLGISSMILFSYKVLSNNLMSAYYGTFSRSFSIILGMLLAYIHINRNKEKIYNKLWFYSLLPVLIILFVMIDFKSILFTPSMILTTLLSLLGIHLGMNIDNNKIKKIIKPITKISYEIYLVQYPVIYFFQLLDLNPFISIPLIIGTIIIVSFLINIILNPKNNKKIRLTIGIFFIGLSIYGCINYMNAKDNTKDMNKLKNDLNENSELIEKKQKEYQEKLKSEASDWNNTLNDFETNEQNLKETVKNLRIVGVGDSIMELAIKNLYEVFPNGYFDAVENRTERAGRGVIEDLINQGIVGDVLLLNIGTNGSCLGDCKENLMETIGDRRVYWLNATNPDFDTFNPSLYDIASKHSNIHIIDWVSVANEHPEYLIYDKVHPTITGCRIYAETIYNAIYEDYLKELREKKEATIKQHEEEENKKITFIGNDLLIGSYNNLNQIYPDSNFVTEQKITYKKLKTILEKKIEDNSMSNNIVIMFDQSFKLSNKQIKEIKEMCKEYNLYIVEMTPYNKIDESIKTIPFYKDLESHKDYISYDNIHLTEKGYKVLSEKIKYCINE